MPAAIAYPGQARLDAAFGRAQAAEGGGNRLSLGLSPATIMRDCVAAVTAGLGMDGRVEALAKWTETADAYFEGATDSQKSGAGRDEAGPLLREFLDSGLVEALGFAPAELVGLCVVAVDKLGAVAVDATKDDKVAAALAERVCTTLPVLPERCALMRALRGAWFDEPAKIYDYVQKLLSGTTDERMWLYARASSYDAHLLREHHRARLDPEGRRHLSDLEQVDAALDKQFGDLIAHGATSALKGAAGAAAVALVGMFSKQAREEEEARKKAIGESRSKWRREVDRAAALPMFGGGDAYLKAFSTFLQGRIEALHQEIPAGISGIRKALENGFDPPEALRVLVQIMLFRGKKDEIRQLVDEWFPKFNPVGRRVNPNKEVADEFSALLTIYAEAGGSVDQILKRSSEGDAAEPVRMNVVRRREIASNFASQGKKRRQDSYREWEAKGVTAVDALLQPAHYDVAIGGGFADTTIRLPVSLAASLCLDETPLIREAGLETLTRLTSDGAPASAAAAYALQLAEALQKRDRLSWKALSKATPVLFQSRAYADRLIDAEVTARRGGEALAMIQHFHRQKVIPDERTVALFEQMTAAHEKAGETNAAADLGEELCALALGEAARQTIRDATAARLVKLSDAVEGLGDKVRFLRRAVSIHPSNESLQAKLKGLESAAMKRNLIIAAVVAGVVGVVLLIYKLVG
jgi:hypothetical protein